MSHSEEISERIIALSPERKALLDQLRRRKPAQPAPDRLIPASPEAKPGPLSFAQERLWFLDKLEPNRSDYNIHSALHLKGFLNIAALEQGLNEIIKRHAILRTGFRDIEGVPFQIISPQLEVSLPVINLTARPDTSLKSQALTLAEEEARRPFDLANPPLIRARLLRLADDDHFLLLTAHHIICDGWSIELFNHELAAFYSQFSGGPTNSLPELPVQYSDYAAWERQQLKGEKLERLQAYWRQKLDPAPVKLELPLDHPRKTPPTLNSRVIYLEFSRN